MTLGPDENRFYREPLAAMRNPIRAPKLAQRILQADGRRYSVRLEVPFWTCIEMMAAGRQCRMNVLVASIAEASEGPNLSSALRVACIEYLLTGRNL